MFVIFSTEENNIKDDTIMKITSLLVPRPVWCSFPWRWS